MKTFSTQEDDKMISKEQKATKKNEKEYQRPNPNQNMKFFKVMEEFPRITNSHNQFKRQSTSDIQGIQIRFFK